MPDRSPTTGDGSTALSPPGQNTVALRRDLLRAATNVSAASGHQVPLAAASALVEHCYVALARDQRVDTHLPLLAERWATQRLADREGPVQPSVSHTTRGLPGSLATFRSVDLDTVLRTASLQDRIDRKYLVTADALGPVLDQWARSHHVLQIEERRSFLYSSVYFDSPDASCHRAQTQGRRRRWKARTRKYLDSDLTRLELKLKGARGRTVKLAQDIDPGQHGRLDASAHAFLAEGVREHYGWDLDAALVAKLTVEYRRATLVDLDAGERITLDTDLRVLGNGGHLLGRLRPGAVLIETKSDALPGRGERTLWSHGIHETPCSKYCAAMMLQGSPYEHPELRRTVRRWFEAPTVPAPRGLLRSR